MLQDEINDFIYVESQIRIPSFQMGYAHFHTYYEIFYLKSGKCTYTVNKKRYRLEAGDIFIVAPGDSHSTFYEGSSPCERIIVYSKLDQLSVAFWDSHPQIRTSFQKTGRVLINEYGREQINVIIDQMEQEHHMPLSFSEEIMKLLLMELLLCIDRSGIFVYECIEQPYNPSQDIEKALRYIDMNYKTQITLDEVADKINLTPTYLSRKFRKVTGTTFKEYLTQIRIKQASQALLTTDDSITQIALDCGFGSSNYFKDIFKKMTGVSPRTYRKRDRAFHSEPKAQIHI